jgi:hypothetical protein
MPVICRLDRTVDATPALQARTYALLRPWAPSPRNADNELYDRSALDPAAASSVPALLGCLEATLNELGRACTTLQQASVEWPARDGDPNLRPVVERMEHGLTNLRVALEDAESASRAARSLAARRLAAAGRAAH